MDNAIHNNNKDNNNIFIAISIYGISNYIDERISTFIPWNVSNCNALYFNYPSFDFCIVN